MEVPLGSLEHLRQGREDETVAFFELDSFDDELGQPTPAQAAELLSSALADGRGQISPQSESGPRDDELLLNFLSGEFAPGTDGSSPDGIPQLADWFGAVTGLVRGGVGTSATPSSLLKLINECPEVDDVPADEAGRLEIAFGGVVARWKDVGVVDGGGALTQLGAWALPRALSRAWKSEFD